MNYTNNNFISNNKSSQAIPPSNLICIGEITSVFGIHGSVKILSYTQNRKDLINYPRIYNSNGGKRYNLILNFVKKRHLVCSIEGIETRNQALELVGLKLHAPREDFAYLPEEEFYMEELKGCELFEIGADNDSGSPSISNATIGKIIAIHNYGAGDIIEIKFTDGTKEMHPFTRQIFPVIDIENGRAWFNPPEVIKADKN
jgi:16S rRNA processing protein RimM